MCILLACGSTLVLVTVNTSSHITLKCCRFEPFRHLASWINGKTCHCEYSNNSHAEQNLLLSRTFFMFEFLNEKNPGLYPCLVFSSRYSGTGRATWSQNSGIWSTTCWCPSCCCVYVPTSTSMMSGKDRGEEEEEKEGKMGRHGLDRNTCGRTTWNDRLDQNKETHTLTWMNFPLYLQRTLGPNRIDLMWSQWDERCLVGAESRAYTHI